MTDASLQTGLPAYLARHAVRTALREDLGAAGDVTTAATVPAEVQGKAAIVAREDGVIAGLQLAEAAFKFLDPQARFVRVVEDGGHVAACGTIATVAAKTPALLSSERVAINFLGCVKGIATRTARYVV